VLLGLRQALEHRLEQVAAEILELPRLKRNRSKSFLRSDHTATVPHRRVIAGMSSPPRPVQTPGDAALLVYPGGDHETYRATWHSADIDFAHRTGFVRLALKLDVPIVPVVAIGGQETALFLGQGERIARLLHLHRLLRIDVAPVQIAPPWGVTVLDLPGRVPLPAKITIDVLPAIDLAAELGADADADAGYDLVTERMQDALGKLAEARTFPVIG
jgi:hypothetical protein